MMRLRIPVVLAFAATAVGCLDTAEVDENETAEMLVTSPQIQDFDPANSIIPFPNILLLSPTTGLNTLPATCGESASAAALRSGILNTLDGVGTWLPAIYSTFTAQVDTASAEGRVFLIKQVADPADAEAVPARVNRFQTVRYSEALPECGAPNVVEGITVTPVVPLDDNAVYTVAVLQGVTSVDGDEFQPSSGWFFSRQIGSPVSIFDRDGDGVLTQADVVYNNTPIDQFDPRDANGNGVADTIERLAGIQQLYGLNQTFLPFVDAALDTVTGGNVEREDILIAWAFKTQTVEAPVDPTASVGPASHVADDAEGAIALFPAPLATPYATVQEFYEAQLGAGICGQLPCAAIGNIYVGTFDSQSYQQLGPNTGTEATPVPSTWDNPINPSPQGAPAALSVLAALPATAAPADGYPLVIFGHGLTRSRGDMLAIAGQLAGLGIATVAIDWPLHGSRAVQIYPTGSACQSAGDAGAPDPTLSAACFAPILSSNLAATRDNFRQGAVDLLRLIEVLKANCNADGTGCNGFNIDATRIGYIGQSLGTLIGQLPVATSSDIKVAVLNVAATSLLDILANTDTNAIKCPLIDALINNGTLPDGKLWQLPAGGFNNTDATCVQTDTTKPIAIADDPRYRQFATAARWVADPAESVNFIDRTAAKVGAEEMAVLVQTVAGDIVLPNEATAILGRLLGFDDPTAATTPTSATFTASEGLADPTTLASWLIYNSGASATYAHGSLLQPAAATIPGSLATGQMQTDAFTFLFTHLSAE